MKKSQSALWSANVDLKNNSQLNKFCNQLESKGFIKNKLNFKNLWKWSIKNNEKFWSEVWDFTKIKGDKKGSKKSFRPSSLFKGVYGTKMGIYSKKLRRTKRDF